MIVSSQAADQCNGVSLWDDDDDEPMFGAQARGDATLGKRSQPKVAIVIGGAAEGGFSRGEGGEG